MNFILNSKKGQVESRLVIVTFLFAFALLSIFGYVFFDAFNTQFSGTDQYYPEVENVANIFIGYMAMFDYLVLFFLVILIIASAVTSYRVSTQPVFFVVTFIIAAFEAFISYFFNYLFSQIVSHEALLSAQVYFPISILICTNLHWIALVTIIVSSIALYGKEEKGQFLA